MSVSELEIGALARAGPLAEDSQTANLSRPFLPRLMHDIEGYLWRSKGSGVD